MTTSVSTPSLWDLNGINLDLCCIQQAAGYWESETNATGHILKKQGIYVEMLDWLAIGLKYKYECLPQRDTDLLTFDNVTKKEIWTQIYRLKAGMCSLIPGPFVITYDRFKDFDFLHPVGHIPASLLIPIPSVSQGDISSVWRPFDNTVWLVLLISLSITMVLSLFDWFYGNKGNNNVGKGRIDLHWLFLFGLLMSKAGYSAPSKLKMRFAGGAWCLAALILTNYYSGALTSLITSANPQPLVDSVEDLASKDNAKLVVVKGYGVATEILSRNSFVTKKLDDKLKLNPNSLCAKDSECIDQVAKTGTTVFIHSQAFLKAAIKQYIGNKTDSCDFTFAKGTFGSQAAAWPISKRSYLYEPFQRGLLRIIEMGLLDKWTHRFFPDSRHCPVDPFERKERWAEIRHPDLVNLTSLYSAFVCLFIGFGLSFMVFLVEWVIFNKVISRLTRSP